LRVLTFLVSLERPRHDRAWLAQRSSDCIRRRRGQGQHQRPGSLTAVAAQHGVSPRWLRLVSSGALDDPAFVRALGKAAASPRLWDLVAPTAHNALLIPTLKIEHLGGSRDDLLMMLLGSIETLRHPANRNFTRDHRRGSHRARPGRRLNTRTALSLHTRTPRRDWPRRPKGNDDNGKRRN
jgi:hypothetical protein